MLVGLVSPKSFELILSCTRAPLQIWPAYSEVPYLFRGADSAPRGTLPPSQLFLSLWCSPCHNSQPPHPVLLPVGHLLHRSTDSEVVTLPAILPYVSQSQPTSECFPGNTGETKGRTNERFPVRVCSRGRCM